ncbi:MAG: hypothetical protein RSD09_02795 [Bacilli bacterium]
MNFLQKLDIINLSDGNSYTVAEMTNEKNIDYLMLVQNDENGNLTEKYKFAKIIVMPTRKYGIETIENKEEKNKLAQIFLPLFKEDYQ